MRSSLLCAKYVYSLGVSDNHTAVARQLTTVLTPSITVFSSSRVRRVSRRVVQKQKKTEQVSGQHLPLPQGHSRSCRKNLNISWQKVTHDIDSMQTRTRMHARARVTGGWGRHVVQVQRDVTNTSSLGGRPRRLWLRLPRSHANTRARRLRGQ